LLEYLKLALRNIKGNLLRTFLTCFIIALGIAALVGIQTAISSLGNELGELYSPFGTSQFTISNRNSNFSRDEERKVNPIFTFDEVQTFKKYYRFPSKVSVNYRVGGGMEIKGNNEKTNPNYSITAVDENFMELNNQAVETGRDFTTNELLSGNDVAIIPLSLKKILFKNFATKDVLNQRITVSGRRYNIVGILEEKGQGFGGGSNNVVYVPLQNAKINFSTPNTNYSLKVGVKTNEMITPAIEEAKGIMRLARGLRVIDTDNFAINNPNAADKELKDITGKVSLAGLLIALVTLSGAAIGLMNILLVMLYFFEGIIISMIGGLLGVILGLLVGLGVAALTKSVFVVPWVWVFVGLFICLMVGLLSSIYPAIKAAKLNPIEALRQN